MVKAQAEWQRRIHEEADGELLGAAFLLQEVKELVEAMTASQPDFGSDKKSTGCGLELVRAWEYEGGGGTVGNAV